MVGHVRSPTVRIDTEFPVDVEAEGQILGQTPAVFSVVADAVRIVLSPPKL
jgi:diacylglycerol kinase family enzyme